MADGKLVGVMDIPELIRDRARLDEIHNLVDDRLIELVERMVGVGSAHGRLSASECHEVRDAIVTIETVLRGRRP